MTEFFKQEPRPSIGSSINLHDVRQQITNDHDVEIRPEMQKTGNFGKSFDPHHEQQTKPTETTL